MRYFWAILKRNFKIITLYKWHYLVNLIINPLILYTFIAVFKTIYSYDASQIIVGYTCNQMIWYFAAVTFFYCLVWCEPEKELSEEILSGNLAIRLTKPIGIIRTTFTNAAAYRVSNFIFTLLPNFMIYCLLVYPDFLSVGALIKYLISSLFSFILLFMLSFLIGITAFKFQSIATFHSLKGILVMMAGVFIPFDFLPGILQALIKALPFQYIYYVPIQLFLNKPETRSMTYFLTTIGSQTFWILIFYFLTKLSWRVATKRFYAVGG